MHCGYACDFVGSVKVDEHLITLVITAHLKRRPRETTAGARKNTVATAPAKVAITAARPRTALAEPREE
ncbi:hypothetical protein SAMCCGM7_pA0365 (plasmid) [Sinorhizobium americanum CCGM7]|uniref:hypothetical protein n=1 Tax=Sinorhizobium americanum TaxID=194963 RepID=UPI0004D8AAA2|nr:hypothetical protein [Sinorhizobium americanum]APG86703.1 hypothetical protein SAMCCGM7_pA0365 [Sinorhizobium americanum CCGM7]